MDHDPSPDPHPHRPSAIPITHQSHTPIPYQGNLSKSVPPGSRASAEGGEGAQDTGIDSSWGQTLSRLFPVVKIMEVQVDYYILCPNGCLVF